MLRIALEMLVGDRGRYFAVILGIFFSALVITQQGSIFSGIMARTYGFLTDTQLPDIWVMDPKVQFIDDIKPLQDTRLLQVRGVEGVQWAVPLYKGLLKARLSNGTFQTCNVIGLDDSSLIGGPPVMVSGQVADLRRAESIIVDIVGASTKLASIQPDGRRVPLKIGDTLELNDHRAVVVGFARVTRTFQSQPVIYTTYSRATTFAPKERKLMSFILVKAKPGVAPDVLSRRITDKTKLAARTKDEFSTMTMKYFLKNTGIPINFGIAFLLGFVIGTAVAGQAFYSFTVDNIRYFGTLKAMGATKGILIKMIVVQALVVGLIGYGMGVGLGSLTYFISQRSELAFKLPWQLLLASGLTVTVICVLSALLSVRRVLKLEPAIVFKS